MRFPVVLGLVAGCYSPAPPTGVPCTSTASCPAGLVCSPATNTCEITATPGDGPTIDMPDPDAPTDAPIDQATSPFAYQRVITVTNNAGTTLPAGYTIRVRFASVLQEMIAADHVRSDLEDVRLFHGSSERDRLVDSPARPDAALSFALAAAIPVGDTDEYVLSYGAPSLTNPPADGGDIYPVYDDFTNGISNEWLVNAAPVVVSGNLVLRANTTDALTTVAGSDGVPIVSAVELVARVVNPASAPTVHPEGTFYYWFGYQHQGDFSASEPWIVWIARAANTIRTEQKSPIGCEMECSSTAVVQNTAFRHYAIERDATATRFYLNGVLASTVATVTNSQDYSIMVRNYMAASNVEIDWIRARGRIVPEPSIAIGDETASP